MSEVKYVGTTEDGPRFDGSQARAGVVCLKCGWLGSEAMLKEVPYFPEDDYAIAGETETVCPNCNSPAWEPID